MSHTRKVSLEKIDFNELIESGKSLTNEQQIALKILFASNQPIIEPEKYTVDINGITCKIELANKIIRRPSESRPDQSRFEVESNEEMSQEEKEQKTGAYGVFYPIIATLALDENENYIIKTNNPRGAKEQNLRDLADRSMQAENIKITLGSRDKYIEKQLENLANEVNITKKIYPGTKEFIINENKISHTIMPSLPGDSMWDVINDDLINVKENIKQKMTNTTLPVDILIDISIEVLQKLQLIHDKNIIHHDLKPENMLAANYDKNLFSTVKPILNIFDFGLSRQGEECKGNGGNLEYAAPEQLRKENGKATKQSDLYSTGRLLANLWHILIFREGNPAAIDSPEFYETKFHTFYLDWLVEKNQIEIKHKEKIIESFTKMTSHKPENRGSIEEAITAFEQIRLEKKFEPGKDAKDYNNELIKAHDAAIVARNKWKQYTQSASGGTLDELKIILTEAFKKIKDDINTIGEFVQTLRIPPFAKFFSKDEITKELQKIQSDFTTYTEKLNTLLQRLSSLEKEPAVTSQFGLTWLETELKLLSKMIEKQPNFDDTLRFNDKCSRKLNNFETKLKKLEQLQKSPSVNLLSSSPKPDGDSAVNSPVEEQFGSLHIFNMQK